MVTAVIVAAGKSERMGPGIDKAFLSLGSKPVVAWSLLAFERCPDVDQIVLVVRKDQLTAAKAVVRMFGISKVRQIVAGGASRQESVRNGLKEMDSDTRIVVVHDGVRPCVKEATISEVVAAARRTGAAVTGSHIWDTVKSVAKGKGNIVEKTEDRSRLWAVQTPQAFNARLLSRAYDEVVKAKATVTDDAAAVEFAGEQVRICETNLPNLKITTAEDLQVAAAIMKL